MKIETKPVKRGLAPVAVVKKGRRFPRVVAPPQGQRPVVRRVPRVVRALPPNFRPRLPQEEDLLEDRPRKRRWPAHYYIIAAILHTIVLAACGYYQISVRAANAMPPMTINLAPTPKPGEGLAPEAPEPSAGTQDRRLSDLANTAPKVAPTPTVPRGPVSPKSLARAFTAPPLIFGTNPKMPSFGTPGSNQTVGGGTADAMAGRRSGAARSAAVARYGGSDASEAAVLKALRWLKQNRNEAGEKAGSWGKQYPVAMTALALLAFLGHGETHDSPEFQQTIREGLNYLATVAEQSKDENGGAMGTARFEYQHPIATYALCEDYALTKYAALKVVCENAASLIVRSQRSDGSWDYDYNKEVGGSGGVYNLKHRPSGDSSISAWNVQALVAAKNAGLNIPGIEEALQKARQWFHHIYNPQLHRFGYAVTDRGFTDAIDGMGILCLQLLGDAHCPEVLETLPQSLNSETRYGGGNANNSYAWYYTTQAMFHAGGHWWADWNGRLRNQLIEHQHTEGYWPMPGSASFQDNLTARKVTGKDAKIYHTALVCLTLEVYYRFLPSYHVSEVAKATGGESNP